VLNVLRVVFHRGAFGVISSKVRDAPLVLGENTIAENARVCGPQNSP
jgi:hypothetical protein